MIFETSDAADAVRALERQLTDVAIAADALRNQMPSLVSVMSSGDANRETVGYIAGLLLRLGMHQEVRDLMDAILASGRQRNAFTYNLRGLIDYASGDLDASLHWFELAYAQADRDVQVKVRA